MRSAAGDFGHSELTCVGILESDFGASYKPVSASHHVCFRFGGYSKEVFHNTSSAAALENLSAFAPLKTPKVWPN
jgi:hypothetical protein